VLIYDYLSPSKIAVDTRSDKVLNDVYSGALPQGDLIELQVQTETVRNILSLKMTNKE
jgi:hypothetical protein